MDGGAIRAAASVALGTLLLISIQAVAVPMEETQVLGADDWIGSNADGTGAPGADLPRVHHDVPALRRSSWRCRAGWAAPVVEKGGCAPPIAQAGCVGPDSRICVRRLHLLAGHHVKVPDRCLRLKKVYDRNVVNKYRLYLLLGVIMFYLIDYFMYYIYILFIHSIYIYVTIYAWHQIFHLLKYS